MFTTWNCSPKELGTKLVVTHKHDVLSVYMLFSFIFLYLPQTCGGMSVRNSPYLIRYFSKTAEQNFIKLSGIIHYMMTYPTSYYTF